MRQIYLAENIVDAQLCKDYVGIGGVDVVIHGEFLAGAAGELTTNSYPTLWLVEDNDENYALARQLVKEFEQQKSRPEHSRGYWQCKECGEELGDQFTHCWQCGKAR